MTGGTMNDGVDREDLIQLEPLIHQVGGHSSIFVLEEDTVCKPLIVRESKFYRTLPPEMKRYAPQFRGILDVVLQGGDGDLSLALPNKQITSLWSGHGALRRKLRRVSSGSVDFESDSDEECIPCASSTSDNSSQRVPPSLNHIPSGDPENPWVQHCHQTHLNKLKQKSDSSNVVECIMLENLTYKYRYPCVLDLKMGKRQYGDDAPESKIRSQTAKAKETTTISLGVRLAGMQVYNRETKRYSTDNKYDGRELTVDGFKSKLREFLHNGKYLHYDILEIVLHKLKELRKIIASLDSFRFFTSSLLILYDSCECSLEKSYSKLLEWHDKDRESSNKSQEPQHSCNNSRQLEPRWENEATVHDTPRCNTWSETQRESAKYDQFSKSNHDRRESSSDRRREASLPDNHNPKRKDKELRRHSDSMKYPMLREQSSEDKTSREQLSNTGNKSHYKTKRTKSKHKVDVRLIDFAHATHKEMGDAKVYDGPDEGFLFGIDNLIKIFQDIREGNEK